MTSSQLSGFGFRLRFLVASAASCLTTFGAAAETVAPSRSHLLPVSEVVQSSMTTKGMGVTLSRASRVLSRQLALKRGAGLVVEAVTPGSAAARAGFEPHDVIVRLDDQLLVLPEQFDALLEAREPEDPLVCTVLRSGQEVAISLGGQPGRGGSAPVVRSLRPTASSLAIVQPVGPAGADARLRRLSDETLLREDGDFRIQLSRGDQTRLTVTDAEGRIVFDAAIDAPADRALVPEAIRARVAAMVRTLEPRPASSGQLAEAAPPAAERSQEADHKPRIGRLDLPPVELH